MTIRSLIYFQSTGKLFHGDKLLHRGYSGSGDGVNNPAYEYVKNVGPIPKGEYLIGRTYTSKKTGPHSVQLIPDADTEMRGRSGFLIHGDNDAGNQTASEGCIIMPPHVRRYVSALNGNMLIVFP